MSMEKSLRDVLEKYVFAGQDEMPIKRRAKHLVTEYVNRAEIASGIQRTADELVEKQLAEKKRYNNTEKSVAWA